MKDKVKETCKELGISPTFTISKISDLDNGYTKDTVSRDVDSWVTYISNEWQKANAKRQGQE